LDPIADRGFRGNLRGVVNLSEREPHDSERQGVAAQSRGQYGRPAPYAIGGNEDAVRLSGVPVDHIKVVGFVIAGIVATLGGSLLTARLGSGEVNVATY
jgi:hypothetical protein